MQNFRAIDVIVLWHDKRDRVFLFVDADLFSETGSIFVDADVKLAIISLQYSRKNVQIKQRVNKRSKKSLSTS